MWFEQLTGFTEESPENVRSKMELKGNELISLVNARRFVCGELDIPNLSELKDLNQNLETYDGQIQVSEVVANVQELHKQPENANALFQAASQFNLLEMISPSVTPEKGIAQYEYDRTQGPACAISCGAGTIYRNYFAEVNGKMGQTENNQIDCLELIGETLGNENSELWTMKNGFTLMDLQGLLAINKKLANMSYEQREDLKSKLKTGIQWNTEVTLPGAKHKVSQIYCSALPVAYNHNIETSYWEVFSRVILEATYESTILAGVLNMEKYKSNKVFLTLVGGGAFGNEEHWILESLQKVIRKYKNQPLDVRIVSYGRSNPSLVMSLEEI